MDATHDDPRRLALTASLSQLSDIELRRILDYEFPMVYDGCNYFRDEDDFPRFCPMAVGLGIPLEIIDRVHGQRSSMRWDGITNAFVDHMIGEIGRQRHGPGFAYNQMHGVPGTFYRDNRAADVRTVCEAILASRKTPPPFVGGQSPSADAKRRAGSE